MIRDIEAMRTLYKFCLAEAESSTIYANGGAEVVFVLPVEALQRVLQRKGVEDLFCDLVMEGFTQTEVSDDLHKDMIYHLQKCDTILLTLHRQGVVYDRVGSFLTYSMVKREKQKPIMYFGGIMVYPDLQDNGYGSALMRYAMKREVFSYVALRTQNPQMYASFAKVCEETFPNGTPPTSEVEKAGKVIATMLQMQHYQSKRMIEKGTYGASLYKRTVKPRGIALHAFKHLNIKRGDSLIAVGERRYLWQ